MEKRKTKSLLKISKERIKSFNNGFDVIQVDHSSMYYPTINNQYNIWDKYFKYKIIKRNMSMKESIVFAKSLNKLTGK